MMNSKEMINSNDIPTMRRRKVNSHRRMGERCRQVCVHLPNAVFDQSGESESPELFDHLSQCRRCLEAYIALLAAAELANHPQ